MSRTPRCRSWTTSRASDTSRRRAGTRGRSRRGRSEVPRPCARPLGCVEGALSEREVAGVGSMGADALAVSCRMRSPPRRHLSMLRSYTPADALTIGNASCGTVAILLCLDYMAFGDQRRLWMAILLLPIALVCD